jgi:hypothetical protein
MATSMDACLRIALLGQNLQFTGNKTTMQRIGSGLSRRGHIVRHVSTGSEQELESLDSDIKKGLLDMVIGLHAYRAGIHIIRFSRRGVPCVTILGGTDVNEMAHDVNKRGVIWECLASSKVVVSFTSDMASSVRTHFHELDFCSWEEKGQGGAPNDPRGRMGSEDGSGICLLGETRLLTQQRIPEAKERATITLGGGEGGTKCGARVRIPIHIIPQAVDVPAEFRNAEPTSCPIFNLRSICQLDDSDFVFFLPASLRCVVLALHHSFIQNL